MSVYAKTVKRIIRDISITKSYENAIKGAKAREGREFFLQNKFFTRKNTSAVTQLNTNTRVFMKTPEIRPVQQTSFMSPAPILIPDILNISKSRDGKTNPKSRLKIGSFEKNRFMMPAESRRTIIGFGMRRVFASMMPQTVTRIAQIIIIIYSP